MGVFDKFFGPGKATFHSSGIAQSSGSTVGATSSQSFSQRQAIDKNRQHVGGYTQAGVHYAYRQEAFDHTRQDGAASATASTRETTAKTQADSVLARRQQAAREVPGRKIDVVRPTGQGGDGRPHPQQISRGGGFSEPAARRYNPFS